MARRRPAAVPASAVEPASCKAEQALGQEDHDQDEDDPDGDEIWELLPEQAAEGLAQAEEEAGADDRAHQGADAAHDVEDDRLARDQEVEEIGRGEAVL